MISCTEFILAYNEIFSFLRHRHGKQAVTDLWIELSDNFLGNLRELVAKKGIQGMKEYWTRTLTEEGADYTMTVEDDAFIVDIHRCPSVGILLRNNHIERYPNYCDHCDVLYRRIVREYGFSFQIEFLDPNRGICKVRIRCITSLGDK